ncbi:heparinase II/III family protein [bacterium]|nr:heparinase II/III family protein [bacterium]
MDWARQWRAELLESADAALSATLFLPDQGAGWSHDYVCARDGRPLVGKSPTAHECPECGAVYSGGYYDLAYLCHVHAENGRRAQDLAVAWALSRQRKYAEAARDLLVAYARKYPSWPQHTVRPGRDLSIGGKMYAQTLSEAAGILPFVAAYDTTYQSGVYSDEDRRLIENQWFREAARVIRGRNSGRSNWQTWHNAALLWIGYALDDARLVERALDGDWGVRRQLEESIDADGFWYEGSLTYHVYALRALVHSAEAAHFHGVNLWEHPKLVRMFLAPIELAWPNGRLPALNDAARSDGRPDTVFRSAFADLCRVAARRTGRIEIRLPYSRQQPGEAAVFYTPENQPPQTVRPPLASVNFPAQGVVQLRGGRDPGSAVMLDYGPHGGGHGHFDKLQLLAYIGGRERLIDPGTVRYSLPVHGGWYRQTLAHNTVVVDGESQRATEGQLLRMDRTELGDWARAAADMAYAGVRMDRTVFLGPEFLVDIYRIDAANSHTYDLAYHITGRLRCSAGLPDATIPLPSEASRAYGYLTDLRAGRVDGAWMAEIADETGLLRLSGAPEPGTVLCAALGPGYSPAESVPVLFVRRVGRTLTFFHVLDWGPQRLEWSTRARENGDVVLSLPGRRATLTFPADRAGKVELVQVR